MITYEQAVAQKRETVLEIVEKLKEAGTGKMDAYALIAGATGKSSTWVRRIVGRSRSVRIDIHDALNIRALHDRLCARIESAAEHEEARAIALEEILHEAGTAGEALVERQAPPAVCGTSARRQAGARVAAAALDARASSGGRRSAEAVSRG